MMKQYAILYKRAGSEKWARLTPNVDMNLYDKPEVTAAVDHLRQNPASEGVSVRIGNEQFNVMAFDQEAEAPRAFIL